MPGVRAVSVANWFGGVYKDDRDPKNGFARFAIEPEKLFRIYGEYRKLLAAAEKERMQASHIVLTQEVSIARGNVDELKAEIERLTTIQAGTQTELMDARKVNSRLAAALDQERLARAVIENSRSWQMTKPFRNMFGLFKS